MKFKVDYLWMIGGIGMMIAAILYLPNILYSSLFMIIGILSLIYLEVMKGGII